MECRVLRNTTSDESYHADALSETDFLNSTKESKNKDAECMFCNGKFSEDEQGEIWIKSFSCSLCAPLDCAVAENAEYIYDFYKLNQSRNGFCIILKISFL